MAKCSKCGSDHNRNNQRYCKSCHAEYMRLHRPKYKDLSREQKKKSNARAYANVYKNRGKLLEQPCKSCGDAAEMHHENYNKPLEIKWLCRECHLKVHNL